MGDRTEREDGARTHRDDFPRKKAIAAPDLVRLGLVLGREAFHGVGHAAADELQAVIRIGRSFVTRKSLAVEGLVQENAGVIARERAAGAVRAVQAGSES